MSQMSNISPGFSKLQLRHEASLTGNEKRMKEKSCPICCNLFLHKSELGDRRPLVACESGDTICADCLTECHKSAGPNSRCPVCGENLLPSPVENRALMQLIESYARVLEIPLNEMERVDKKPFARDGCNRVYNARWRRQDVIIKVIKSDDDRQMKDNSYEVNLVIGLLHPNVIRLFGTTRMHSHFGIVMEKAAHGSLDAWIGKIERDKIPKIALGIVSGLEYIHSRKVVHRDIRPMTIFMCGPRNDMVPKIGDFSACKVIQSVTAHTQVGDDFYCAPEVFMCSRYGFTADVYSLAITLFELFNGQMIRVAPTEIKRFIFAVKAGRIGKIPDTCRVPANLRSVVERGCGRPEDRPNLSEYKSVLEPMTKKPELVLSFRQRRVSRTLQAEEMASRNVSVPAQAVSWSEACEVLGSRELRLQMVNDIRTKSTLASLINDSVLRALSVVPRHLFVEMKKLVRCSLQEVVETSYVFSKAVPATTDSVESPLEILAAQLSMTEIIQGQSVLLVGVKGGYTQALIAQLVGINGSVESVSMDDSRLQTCQDRIDRYCPLSSIVDWVKVTSITDCASIAEQLKQQQKVFHTIIVGCALDKFPFALTEPSLLYGSSNVSVLAPVKDDDGVVRFQLYLRRANDAELRTITDFESSAENAC